MRAGARARRDEHAANRPGAARASGPLVERRTAGYSLQWPREREPARAHERGRGPCCRRRAGLASLVLPPPDRRCTVGCPGVGKQLLAPLWRPCFPTTSSLRSRTRSRCAHAETQRHRRHASLTRASPRLALWPPLFKTPQPRSNGACLRRAPRAAPRRAAPCACWCSADRAAPQCSPSSRPAC